MPIRNHIGVYDGVGTNDTLLGTFTGIRDPFSIQTSGRFTLLKLTKKAKYYLCNFKGVLTSTTKGYF